MIRPAPAQKGRAVVIAGYPVLATAMLAVVMMLAAVSPALAHAALLATDPADGATLKTQPSTVTLRFNEPVAPVLVRVIGPDGRTISTPGGVRAVDTRLQLSLPDGLPEGRYLVSYRVVSADSHPVGGSFAFAIGETASASARPPDETAGQEGLWQTAKMLLRFVQNIALMLAAGGALFSLLVLRAEGRVRGLVPMIAVAGGVAMLAAVLGVGVQGGLLVDAPPGALFDWQTWRMGAVTTVGTATIVQVAALAVVVLATLVSAGALARTVSALGALAATASLALTGHSAASGWPAQAALALHTATVAYWLGALWPLYTIVRTRPPTAAAVLVRRFSAIAVPAVALLIAAGVGTALTRVADPVTFLESSYALILLLKLAFVALLLAIAVANRWRITPALAGGSDAAAALARNIRLELALAAIVLALTAVLAHTAPPHRSGGREAASGHAVTAVSRGHRLLLKVTPARVGTNDLTLSLADQNGRPVTPIEVKVVVSLPAAGIEPLVRSPERVGEGRYALERLGLPRAGRWTVRVEALISDFEKRIFTTEIPIR